MRLEDTTFHLGRGISAVSLAVLLVLILANPPATARFCRGEQERVRIFANYIGRRIDTHLGSMVFAARRMAGSMAEKLPVLALRILHLQARDKLAGMLKRAAENKEDFPSLEDIRSGLQPFWDRAVMLQQHLLHSNVEYESKLPGILKEVLLNWVACQAFSSLDPDYCEILKSVDINKRIDCRLNLARLGVLYAGNCKGDLVDFAAETINYSRSDIEKGCEILAKRQTDRCNLFGDFEFICLALCRGDAGACRTGELNEKQSRECLRELLVFETIHSKKPLAEFLKEDTGILLRVGVLALQGRNNCTMGALERYEQLVGVPFLPAGR